MQAESEHYNASYVQEKAFGLLIELLIIFGNDTLVKSGSLYYKPSKQITQNILEFLISRH